MQPPYQRLLTRFCYPFERLAEKLPAVYMILVGLAGLVGFFALLFFPALSCIGLVNAIGALSGDISANSVWSNSIFWLSITLLAALVSYQLITFPIALPAGVELDKEKTPKLFDMLDELKQEYRWVAIDRIIIVDGFNMDIVSTPKYVLPVWNTHTLRIGMALLQCLSPTHFKCLLARKLGQFSKQQNFTINILYQLRHDWSACRQTYSAKPSFGLFPLALFFRIYAPCYALLSTCIARMDELRADAAAQRIFNGEDVLDAIEKSLVARRYIDKHFWPAIRDLINKDPNAKPAPYDKLLSAFKNTEGKPVTLNLLKLEYALIPAYDDPLPSLGARMDNLGHTKLVTPTLNATAASLDLLGKHYWRIVQAIDKQWYKQTGRQWRQAALQAQEDRLLFNRLYLKAKCGKLSYQEWWDYLRVVRRLSGRKPALRWQDVVLRRLPDFAAGK